MIHFPALMTMESFVETPPAAPQPQPASGLRRPADYYSAPPAPRALPRWVPYGCGGVSLLILILVFAGGAFLARGGFTDLMDMMFGMTMGEMRGMYAADVSAGQKAELEAEIKTMREHLRAGKVNMSTLQPLLKTMQKATADEKLNANEVGQIVAAAKKVNGGAVKKTSRRETESPSRRELLVTVFSATR
jgi:hypothetical protein